MSRDLIGNLISASGSLFTVRIGSPEGDYSVYNPDQEVAVAQVGNSSKPALSIGPSFFESVTTLAKEKRIDWIHQVPFAGFNISNAVQGALKAVQPTPKLHLFALEIGHQPNLYAGVSRTESYDCRMYAAEFFQYKVALRQGIGRIATQFQALGLSSANIDDSWTM